MILKKAVTRLFFAQINCSFKILNVPPCLINVPNLSQIGVDKFFGRKICKGYRLCFFFLVGKIIDFDLAQIYRVDSDRDRGSEKTKFDLVLMKNKCFWVIYWFIDWLIDWQNFNFWLWRWAFSSILLMSIMKPHGQMVLLLFEVFQYLYPFSNGGLLNFGLNSAHPYLRYWLIDWQNFSFWLWRWTFSLTTLMSSLKPHGQMVLPLFEVC